MRRKCGLHTETGFAYPVATNLDEVLHKPHTTS